ncbi:MAG: PQQ-binding-like beta-propeller repeat protein [Anaerolineae bacterium]
MKRLLRWLRRLLFNPIVLGLIVLVLAGWWLDSILQPVIVSVPILHAGQGLTLIGHGFGGPQTDSYVIVQPGNRRIQPSEIVSWSDNKVVTSITPTAEGTAQVLKGMFVTTWPSATVPFVVQQSALPSQPNSYQVPVQADSPWPLFRRDQRNTGNSPLPAIYHGDKPWAFKTGKGIFSTPIVDSQGIIYVGSADHIFYALNPDGTEHWRFPTGEIIDSAGALPRVDPQLGYPTVIFPSGDGHLYALRTDSQPQTAAGRLLWSFDARTAPGAGFNNWFEGNVGIGYDGTLYAGSTNFNYYALTPDGKVKWTYRTGSNNWSLSALGDDGTIFWASNDTYIRAVRPDGKEKWNKMTLGFIAASAAIGSDGTVYIGSFDSYLYALDPNTGAERCKFKTNDHIYTSAALGSDAQGNTSAVYFGSADGTLYAMHPDCKLIWKYDTGDPIRSSPVVGRTPDGKGDVIYFGSGNGKLYALNADGTRRWSYDTTSDDPELRDRNDLNASPALGLYGVYIAGETGQVFYLPYDYCLNVADPRCATAPGQDWPTDMAGLFYVTPGGNTEQAKSATIAPATMLTLRLMVRKSGQTVNAWVCNSPIGCSADEVKVTADPPFSFELQHSADGKYLYIRPQSFLAPGQKYTVKVEGNYYTGGTSIGNLTIGGDKSGQFGDTLTFQVEPTPNAATPFTFDKNRVSAFEWTRLAAPIPTMLPSLNQIGFDYMDWLVGTVALTPPDAQGQGKVILWAIGAKRDEKGSLVPDPKTEFTLPLSGTYQGDSFILQDQKFTMPITGIPIPFDQFELRGRMGLDSRVEPGASAYAETNALDIPKFGPYLVVAGLANNWVQKMLVSGTYITRGYDELGTANVRPDGVSVKSIQYFVPDQSLPGKVIATLNVDPGVRYPQAAHHPGILLVDRTNLNVAYLDYKTNLSSTADAAGNLSTITLNLPKGTALPQNLQAIVILDVFPIYEGNIGQ